MNRIFKIVNTLLLVLITMIFLSGCATLFNGAKDRVIVSSYPDAAKVYINGIYAGPSPLSINLIAKKTYHIVFKKAGHPDTTYMLKGSFCAGYLILDALLGGLTGVLIDAVTGNFYNLDDVAVRLNTRTTGTESCVPQNSRNCIY